MINKNLAAALGALTGLLGLVGMIRLVSGAFSNGMTTFAWAAILLAMLPWIVYAAWRGGTAISVPAAHWRSYCSILSAVWWCGSSCSARCCLGLLTRRICRHLGQRLAAAPLAGQDRYVRIEEFRNADDS